MTVTVADMTDDATDREVFREIDPDPDAVLAEFGVESPADLVATAEAREADSPDEPDELDELDELEVDDSSIAALFDDVEANDPTLEASDAANRSSNGADRDADRAIDDLEFEFVGDADVIVRDDGAVIDASAAELSAFDGTEPETETAGTGGRSADERAESAATVDADRSDGDSRTLTFRERGADDLKLVGAEPTTTRIADEAFGTDGFAGR